MADHDAARLQGHLDPKAGLLTPENRHRNSHETGESSRSGGNQRRGTSGPAWPSPYEVSSRQGHQSLVPCKDDDGRDLIQRAGSTRRKRRPVSGGGFLLHNSISGNISPAPRGPFRNALRTNGKAAHLPQTPQSSRPNNRKLLQPADNSGRKLHDGTSVSPQSASGRSDGSGQRSGTSTDPEESSPQALPRSSEEDSGDIDSTQIVQMALNLSESRRIVSWRHASRATPPRLGTLPDGSSGSNLRQHLQQQRKFSYNGSPKIPQAHSPRLPSSSRLDGSLQPGFEGTHDAHYRYQFSTSTLARAQKAKEHLELMAQYRRLLDVLPPLKSGTGPKLATSPPGSPIGIKPFRFGHGDNLPLGRQYNPLQYIRNRKVRARERKIIDGEKQGFDDVDCVKPWVDKVIERATSFATNPDDDGCELPKYPGVDDLNAQTSNDNLSRTVTRVRRPRVDWFVEPCDMMADAYWLEQDNHKELIEDRHWRKIFPPLTTLSRPMSRETTVGVNAIPPFSMQDDDPLDTQIHGVSKVDPGMSHSSARDKAKQTLHNIRAFPHRHNGYNMYSEFLQHKRGSASDVSGSENDARRSSKKPSVQMPGAETSPNNGKRNVEKRMLDMIGKDAREEGHPCAFSEPEPDQYVSPDSLRTPERNPSSMPSSRFHSRKGSMADTSDSDRKAALDKFALGSPVRHVLGRQSLDVPDRSRRDSLGRDYSLPTSPELRPTRGSAEPFATAQHPPSWSRSGSPHRNPISKIKQIIRDKTNEREGDEEDVRQVAKLEPVSPEKAPLPKGNPSSPSKNIGLERVPVESVKTHRRTGSTRHRADDAAGLRGIFKGGPRIDTVIRGGVSKLGDMLWKRDGIGVGGLPAEFDTTDESENEKARGRSASSTNVSRRPSRQRRDEQTRPKQYLDIMPQFNQVHDTHHPYSADASRVDLVTGSAGYGQQLSRSDTLRLARIDGRSASSSALPESRYNRAGESDASDLDSRQGSSVPDGVRDADKRLNPMLEALQPEADGRSFRSRHWSIADKGLLTEETRLTRREIARIRALVLSTGIKAMEINRRARETHKPFRSEVSKSAGVASISPFNGTSLDWDDIAKLCPEAAQSSGPQIQSQVAFYELYSFAGRSLSTAIQNSGRRWQASADQFTYRTSPQLQNRIGDIRSRIADDLSEQSRRASDLADETNRDLALGQPLKVKAVVDIIEKMLRRRRRRLRWIRRALWLTVEWLLVGFMWYVWFMVMILRVFLGIGKGVVNSARWLLWL